MDQDKVNLVPNTGKRPRPTQCGNLDCCPVPLLFTFTPRDLDQCSPGTLTARSYCASAYVQERVNTLVRQSSPAVSRSWATMDESFILSKFNQLVQSGVVLYDENQRIIKHVEKDLNVIPAKTSYHRRVELQTLFIPQSLTPCTLPVSILLDIGAVKETNFSKSHL